MILRLEVALQIVSLLPRLLIFTILLTGPTSSADAPSSPTRHALFIAIPLPGHLVPLISLAHSLQFRGWRTSIASLSPMRDLVLAPHTPHPAPPPAFVDLGDCAGPYSQLSAAVQRSANSSSRSWLWSSLEVLQWAQSLHLCMWEGLSAAQPLLRAVDVVVADFATSVALDYAEQRALPFLINDCNALGMLHYDVLAPLSYLPALGSGTPLSLLRWPSAALLAQRLLFPLLVPLAAVATHFYVQWPLDNLRRAAGLRPIPITSLLRGRVILVDTVWGVEYARPVSPLVSLVGPMLNISVTDAEWRAQLSAEEERWLSEGDGAVYVAFGTIATLSASQTSAMFDGLSVLAANYSVLWALRGGSALLPSGASPPLLRAVARVGSQMSVLSHPRVALFVSHCGVNSLHEALHFAVPLLCVPVMAEQGDSAQRVEDAGLGLRIDMHALTADGLVAASTRLLGEGRRAVLREARRMSEVLRKDRGLQRAGDLVELVATVGIAHLRGADEGLPVWAREGVDVAAVYAVAVWALLSWLSRSCWGRWSAAAAAGGDCSAVTDTNGSSDAAAVSASAEAEPDAGGRPPMMGLRSRRTQRT